MVYLLFNDMHERSICFAAINLLDTIGTMLQLASTLGPFGMRCHFSFTLLNKKLIQFFSSRLGNIGVVLERLSLEFATQTGLWNYQHIPR